MAVIRLPALLIAIVLGSRLWREAGIEARARREAENMAASPPEDAVSQ